MQLRVPCEKFEILSFTSSIMKNINPFLFRKTLCNCLCSSSCTTSCDSASFFWNTEEFGAKNYFTHHSTADTIHSFSNTRLLLGYSNIWITFHFYPSDTRRLQCVDVNNPLQRVFKCVCTVCIYSNCMKK